MTAKRWAALISIMLIGYLILLGMRSVELIRTGQWAPMALGIAVLLLPAIGLWALVREWRFGQQIEQMADELAAAGRLPVDDLPRMPSGRVQRDAADQRFADAAAQLDEDRTDWRRWYLVAEAYDTAGDRKRARAAMREAVRLHSEALS